MENPTHARMAKEVPGLTTYIASRTRLSLQPLSVSISLLIEAPRSSSSPFALVPLTIRVSLNGFFSRIIVKNVSSLKSRRNLRCADVQGPTGLILRSQEPKAQGNLAKAEAKVSLCDSLAFASAILVDRLRFSIAMLLNGLSRLAPHVFVLSSFASFSIHPSWMLERHWKPCCTPDRWIRRKNSRKLPSSC